MRGPLKDQAPWSVPCNMVQNTRFGFMDEDVFIKCLKPNKIIDPPPPSKKGKLPKYESC